MLPVLQDQEGKDGRDPERFENVKSIDDLKSFKPLQFKKFAIDRHFPIKDIDNVIESKL
jgi:hypothetical protein